MVRLNHTYSLLNLQAKSFSKIFSNFAQFAPKYSTPFINTLCFRHLPRQRTLKNSSELRKFRAIRPHSPRITRNSHHLLTYYTLCFRCLTSGRELPKIPANRTKFAQFAHIPRELRELCAFRTKFTHI